MPLFRGYFHFMGIFGRYFEKFDESNKEKGLFAVTPH
jgi:hypothetical protein